MLWIFFTIMAAFMQTFRNALQSKLSGQVNTIGVTLARFIFAAPLAWVYLLILYGVNPQPIPDFNSQFIIFIVIAALMQILATALMVQLFKQKNFAIGAGLAKSEALVAAILGTLFFGSQLNPMGWLGVLIGAIAVFLLSGLSSKGSFSIKTVLIGLASGASFALTSLYVREASIAIKLSFPHSAAWVLAWVLTLQCIILIGYCWLFKRDTFVQMRAQLPTVSLVSLTSLVGSIGWFSAMSLQYVAYVKTLGQIEVLFTILLATLWLKQKVKTNELLGLLLIAIAAILVMWQ